jgi:solute carrier family 23 (nucleobase transporter), member 1
MSTNTGGAVNLNYGIDDVPKPFYKALGLGMQHVLTMFGATILVPLIVGPALGFQGAQIAILISSVFIASGIATAIQVTIGSRLPIVQGVSFAFLGGFFAIAGSYQGAEAMRYIAGMIIIGAILEVIIGFGGLMGFLRRFITPITIGPVIALIGLTLFGAAADTASSHWPLALITLALTFIYSLLLAVITAYAFAYLMTLAGVFTGAAAVDFSGAGATPWVRGFEVGGGGVIFPWGTPLFDFTFVVAFLAAYMASAIESFGDYHAISRMARGTDPSVEEITDEGLGCAATALVGGFASTSYSENIGLVGLTKVASRRVVLIGAVALIVLGLVTKVGGIITTIPTPIVGGIYLSLFGLIAAVGLSNLRRADMDSQRNLMIVGFVLFSGFVFPAYFAGAQDFSFFGIGWATTLISSIFSSGIAAAAVLGILLDNLIPGTDEERGIGGFEKGVVPPSVHGQ